MDLGVVIDVALGMIFMWITLSMATIQIQEWIMTRLDKRAKDMEASIHEMLANPNLRSQFYDHPVIRSLTSRKRKKPSTVPNWFYKYPIVRGFTREKRKLPSYIPAQNFTMAIFDMAMTAGTESSMIQQGILKIRDDFQKASNKPTDQAVIEALNILSDLARSAAATEAGTSITNYTKGVLTDRVNRLAQRYLDDEELKWVGEALKRTLVEASLLIQHEVKDVKKADDKANAAKNDEEEQNTETTLEISKTEPVLVQLRQGIAALSVISPELNQTMSTLLSNVEEYTSERERQLAKARGNVEDWFNSSMDRVSGVFKRYTQYMALILGLLLSSFLNVDSISVAQYLWREPTVRQVLAAQAISYQPPKTTSGTAPTQTVQQVTAQLSSVNLPVGWALQNNGGPSIYDNHCQMLPKPGQLFGIPIVGSNYCVTTKIPLLDPTNIFLKILGILITAAATAQGAPFWFDLLKKVVNLRATGPNPAEKGATK